MTADTRRPTARPSSTESIPNPPTGALSASRLSLAARCPGAFALPHAEHDSPQAATGTAIHAYVAAVLDGEHEPLAEVEDAKAREVCSRLSTSALVETVGGHEALVGGRILNERAVALDPRTGRAVWLDSEKHRDYATAPEGSIPGTADVVTEYPDSVLVTDWKTGAYGTGPAENNQQLRFLALAAARALGKPEATAQLVHVSPDGHLDCSEAAFGAADLARIQAETQHLLAPVDKERATGARPRLRVGSHCRYCPAFAFCPAQSGAAQALVELKEETLTPASARAAYEALLAAEAATKRVRQTLTDYAADHGPFPAADPKREVRVVETTRDKLDASAFMPRLRKTFGDAADAAASVSKTAISNLARSEFGLPKPQADKFAQEMVDALAESGAVSTTTAESLREANK